MIFANWGLAGRTKARSQRLRGAPSVRLATQWLETSQVLVHTRLPHCIPSICGTQRTSRKFATSDEASASAPTPGHANTRTTQRPQHSNGLCCLNGNDRRSVPFPPACVGGRLDATTSLLAVVWPGGAEKKGGKEEKKEGERGEGGEGGGAPPPRARAAR